MSQVFIDAMGGFLPGLPVGNEEMEQYLGCIHGKPSRARQRILRQNGILTRHYALDLQHQPTHRVTELAALAVRDLFTHSEHGLGEVDFLAAASTQPDLLVPGFASEVHRELKNPRCEVFSLAGVCASGLAALKSAYLQVKAGERRCALAVAAEMPSRILRASFFERQQRVEDGGTLPLDAEFLRWMLSDGAGAALLTNHAPRGRLGFRVDWVELRSFAHQHAHCMFSGGLTSPQGKMGRGWLAYPNPEAAAREGALNLQQDVRMLDGLVQLGVDGFLALVEEGKLAPAEVDWMVCHYSSRHFRGRVLELVRKGGVNIPDERWFSNLDRKGNTGSASIFLMLEELLNEGKLELGQKLVCVVPESGGFQCGYMHLTVVGEKPATRAARPTQPMASAEGSPALRLGEAPLQQSLVRQLARVWMDFERRLGDVPVLARLEEGTFSAADYRELLLNLRQQVVEGARWIARAASSLEGGAELLALRPLFLQHARDEQLDYQMLERDYVSVGGELAHIHGQAKNVGSEALSAWMFHRASQPNPLDLLGAMFIIEGLGNRMAPRWAERISTRLALRPEQVSFLGYHGQNDGAHFEKLEAVLGSGVLTETLVERVVKTAKVTGRLYRLQLEELGNV